MASLTNISILLVLACFSHQLMLGSCQKVNGRRGRGMDRGQHKDRPGQKVGREQKSVSAQPVKGKLVTKDKSDCTWAATGERLITLGVTCNNGDRSFSCDYVATPAACPLYTSNAKLYWRQIARALKKQRSLCRGGGELVRAGVCRGAASDAHFRLKNSQRQTNTSPPAPTPVKSCQRSNKELADEYCSDSWSSFCTFLFAMVQDNDC